jgi:PAS domain S-box-containing protein
VKTDELAALAAPFASMLPVAAGVINAKGHVLWSNDRAQELFAWDVRDRPRVHLSEMVDPELLGLALDTQQQMIHAGLQERSVHGRLRRFDGTHFEADCKFRAVTLHDGQMVIVCVVLPTAESQLDNPFRRALDLQRELICEWSPGGTILFTNRAYREWFGYGDDVVGRNLDEYVDWADGDDRAATIARFTAGEHTILHTRTYPDGRAIEWANTLVRTDEGTVISVLGVGRDITSRLHAEEALRRNEERFRMMVTYIWDSIMLLDRNGQVLDATSAYRSDLGYDTDFWEGASPFDVLHPDDQQAAAVAFASLMERGPKAEAWMEVRALRADGTYSWLELNAANLLDDPSVEAIILTVRNVDNRKRIELELAERHAESQSALRRRVGFVAQVSHELRNPLHGMLGLSELLAKADLQSDLADAAWALYRQSTTMRRIVDDLLDVAQLEVGTLRVRAERVDLQYVFNDSMVVARELAGPGVDVGADDPPPDLRYVQADPDRVRQVLVNLLSNACKHTHAGDVVVRATTGSAPGTVRVTVLDSGSGIDVADVDRLFQPYERGPREGSPGVGLGLAIVKGTVEAMGGTVGAAPRPEGGSAFWFELPLATTELPSSQGAPTTSTTDDDARFDATVLVVDDDPVNRLVATLQLRELGAQVVTAASGDEAWTLLQEHPFDVAFIDVQMPGMSGLELVRLTRTLPSPHPLMAVMTASATAADQQAAIDAGADMFVPKPATVNDIRATMQRHRDLSS